jgi:hypothetical protein
MQSLVTQFMRAISRLFILLFTLSFINFAVQAKTLWQEGSSQVKSEQVKPLRAMAENARFI